MSIQRALARQQILRLLRTYTAGMTREQLYVRLECSIPHADFVAELDKLITSSELEETGGVVRLAQAAVAS